MKKVLLFGLLYLFIGLFFTACSAPDESVSDAPVAEIPAVKAPVVPDVDPIITCTTQEQLDALNAEFLVVQTEISTIDITIAELTGEIAELEQSILNAPSDKVRAKLEENLVKATDALVVANDSKVPLVIQMSELQQSLSDAVLCE